MKKLCFSSFKKKKNPTKIWGWRVASWKGQSSCLSLIAVVLFSILFVLEECSVKAFDFLKWLMALDALLEESTSFPCEKNAEKSELSSLFQTTKFACCFLDSAYTLKIGNVYHFITFSCVLWKVFSGVFFFWMYVRTGEKPIDAGEPFFQEREGRPIFWWRFRMSRNLLKQTRMNS